MKIEAQPREDHQVKLIVEFEPEVYTQFKQRAARKISQESKVPGFRPGKAPYDVVRRLFGDRAIENRAVDMLIDKEYPEIIKQAELQPSGPGSLQNIVSTDTIKLELLVPLQPEVDLGDYHSIREDYQPEPVPEEEVDKFIERLRNNYASVEPVERPIQETDLVYLTISGHYTAPNEGENPEVFAETPQQVIIQTEDEQKPEEWPFPGFTRQLIDLSAEDEKTFTYTYPEDAKDENLREREVEFHVHIQSVKAMKLPELTDEFAQTVGEYDTVEAMRSSIKERMEVSSKEQYEDEYIVKVIDKIRDQATIKYPPQMVDEEINHLIERLQRDLAQQKLDLDTYLKIRKLEKEQLIEQEIRPAALLRLERSLIMDEISRAENLQLDQSMVASEIEQTVNQMDATGELKKIKRGVTAERFADAVAYDAASRLMSRQTVQRLKDIATGAIEQAAETEPTAEADQPEPTQAVPTEGQPDDLTAEIPSSSADDVIAEQPNVEEDAPLTEDVDSEVIQSDAGENAPTTDEELADQSPAESSNK